MKTHRFYSKSYEHPASRFSLRWQIDHSHLLDLYDIYADGGSVRKAAVYSNRHNLKLTHEQLRYFRVCSKRYYQIRLKGLKIAQSISEELAKYANKRDEISLF